MKAQTKRMVRATLAGIALTLAATQTPAKELWTAKSPFLKGVQTAPHLEPAIPHPEWEAEAQEKLAGLEKRFGRKPNILLIMVDDMGWGDPGAFGGGSAIGAPTPQIDALAAMGMKLTSTYSQPSCTPSRAAWQTGRLPQRTGLTRPTAAGEPNAGMAGEVTIASLLSDAGYVTGMVGKWHLGEDEGQWPTDVGWDTYYGNLNVNTAYHDWRDVRFSPELVNNPDRVAAMNKVNFIRSTVRSTKGGERKFGEEITLETEPLLEMKYLDWSKAFMSKAVEEKKPFLLYHSMNRVHSQNYPNPDFLGSSPAGTPYKDGIMEVGFIVGKLMDHLESLGQLENTFVFFTSDNGAEEDTHAAGIGTSDAGHHPWRGAKGTTWEGGMRVSGIAHWPGMIAEGRVSDGLFSQMDLYNTMAAIGGTSAGIPSDRYIDGIDQTSWLLTSENDGQESNREAVYYWYYQDFYGVRWNEFKRMERIMTVGMNPGPGTYGGLFNATKSETSDPTLGWFYNLYADPKERAPITRTWAIAPLAELSIRNKLTFLQYPQAPRGVVLNGYILGGPAGGTVPDEVLESFRTMGEADGAAIAR